MNLCMCDQSPFTLQTVSHVVTLFISGFYVAFNTLQVISRRLAGRAEETSRYSSSGFCTINCRPTASNYQLSHLRPCREPNPGLRGGRRECYHSATVAPSPCGYRHLAKCPCPLIYLFGVLRRFQHCTGHITTGSWKGRGNQYIQFARVLYCKLPTNGKQLPAFPLKAMTGIEPRPHRWEPCPLTTI